MARMIPETFPAAAQSKAERRVYNALQDLAGPYTVLYDVAWLGRGEHEGRQGQCDFLVLHPSHGALVVEIKGGTIRRAAEGGWRSSGAKGDFAIDDPFAQANRSKFALRDSLRSCGNGAAADALWGHAVWFPDTSAPPHFGPDAHSAITLDYNANAAPGTSLERAFEYWRGRRRHSAIGASGIQEIVSLLGRRMELKLSLFNTRFVSFIDALDRVAVESEAAP